MAFRANKNIYEILAEVLPHMKAHPGMYLHPVNFGNLRTYMDGFINGLSWNSPDGGNGEISRWLSDKMKGGHDVPWTSYVLTLAAHDERKAWELLFYYLEEFLKEKGYPPSEG